MDYIHLKGIIFAYNLHNTYIIPPHTHQTGNNENH